MTQEDTIAVGRRVLETEAEGLSQLASSLDHTFALAVECLVSAKGRIVCTGIGKSGQVARKIAATLASTGSAAMFVHPSEASHGDLGMIGPDDVILALSKTGETRELADVIAFAARFQIPLIGMTTSVDSTLGLASDIVLRLPDAQEATDAVNAPTTSTTLQMALGDALAVALLERRGFKPGDFKVLHPGGKLGAMLRTVADLMHGREELPLVKPDTPMRQALLVMTQMRWGIVGVVDPGGVLLGAITDGDLRRHIDGLLERTAGDVMTEGPKKVAPPQMLAGEALALMSDPAPAVTVLFVVDDGKPVGILHVHDLLRSGVM